MSGYLSLSAHETYARWSVVFVAIVIAILCLAGYFFAPKGDNQTYSTHTVPWCTSTALEMPLPSSFHGPQLMVVSGGIRSY
jgi:hypothetical protein